MTLLVVKGIENSLKMKIIIIIQYLTKIKMNIKMEIMMKKLIYQIVIIKII